MRRRYVVVVVVSRERLLRMSLRNVFVWGASLRAFTWAANAFVAKMPMAHNARNPTRPFAAIRCVGERQFSCRRTAAHEPTHTLTARLPARRLARVYQTEFQSEKIVRIDKTRWISRIGPSICVLFHFILFCSVFLFIVFSLSSLCCRHRRTYEWIGVRVCSHLVSNSFFGRIQKRT